MSVLEAVVLAAMLAGGGGAERLVLKVGRPVELNPGFLPAQVICDDLATVRVEDIGKAFRVTGLKVGETLCSFTSLTIRGRRLLVRVSVRR